MPDKKLWLKNNKLIAEGGVLTGCDNCPCPYYAVFTIIAHPWNPGDDDNFVNQCSQTLYTAPFAVYNDTIYYNGMCIPVNRTPQDKLVGSRKGCSYSYPECVEYDPETWECIKTENVYVGCFEYKVYRLSGCYDCYNDFAKMYYGHCGMDFDGNDSSLNLFKGSNQQEASDAALGCTGYWDETAYKLFMPSFDLVFRSYRSSASVNPFLNECTATEDDPSAPCARYAEDGSCIEYEHWQHCIAYCWSLGLNYNGEQTFFPIMDDVQMWSMEHPCCEYNANFLANIPKINQKITDIKTGRDYPFTESTISFPTAGNGLCWDSNYMSDASYGPWYWLILNWGYDSMIFKKNASTPGDATGVKVSLKKKHITYTYEKNAAGQCIRSEEVTEETQEISINFDEPYELPEADNLPAITDWGENPCSSRYPDNEGRDACDFTGMYYEVRPNIDFVGGCGGVFERYEFKFAAISLIFP